MQKIDLPSPEEVMAAALRAEVRRLLEFVSEYRQARFHQIYRRKVGGGLDVIDRMDAPNLCEGIRTLHLYIEEEKRNNARESKGCVQRD